MAGVRSDHEEVDGPATGGGQHSLAHAMVVRFHELGLAWHALPLGSHFRLMKGILSALAPCLAPCSGSGQAERM